MLDWQTALKFTAGGDLLGGIGAGLGLPSCLTELGSAALSLLPAPVLAELNFQAQEMQAKIDGFMHNISSELSDMFGLDITITPNGQLSIISRNSKMGMGGLGAMLGMVAGLAQLGAGLYAQGKAIGENIDAIASCLKQLSDTEKFTGANGLQSAHGLSQEDYDSLVNDKAGHLLFELDKLKKERGKWSNLQDRIDGLRDHPIFTCTEVDIDGIPVHLSSLGFDVSCAPEIEAKEIIRLVFGPPVAKEGQFVLSKDGLYYDSQSSEVSGVTQVLLHLDKRKIDIPLYDRWKFEYDPNLGGKGIQYSSKSVIHYVDTIFDPEIIDETPSIRKYYDADHFLEVLESQKAKRIYDLSSHISEYIDGDAGAALIQNAKQCLYSEVSLFEYRIKKRKKQLELAVKMPMIYGGTSLFAPGEVPLNDFSYLQQFNFAGDIHKQKALVLDQADVTGVISPVIPKFVISKDKDEVQNIEHLYIADIGKGDILYSDSASSIVAPKLSITDRIVDDRLFAIYNYLESNVVAASSNDFNVANCAVQEVYNNAQLVSNHASSVFVSGVGIVNLTGVTKQIAGDEYNSSDSGNFIKLPESPEFYDLTYKLEGFTFESWMHVPYLTNVTNGWTENGASSLYRLVLANENNGMTSGLTAQSDPERLEKDLGDGFVKGMMMGFTRDRRLTQNTEYTDTNEANLPTSSLAFFIAPTQAVNDTSVGLIHTGCPHDNDPDWFSFTVDASTTSSEGNHGLLLSSADKFVLVSLVMNPIKNKVSLYVNGELMAASSLENTFGRDRHSPVEVPSFHKSTGYPNWDGSFSYVPSSVGGQGPEDVVGPYLGTYFTPTILGGGYTDGIGGKGFMGNKTFGTISGLRGYLGSTKFYDKALDKDEVLINYNAQKELFENINTVSTYTKDGS